MANSNVNYNITGPVMWAKLRDDNRDQGEYAPEGGQYVLELGVDEDDAKLFMSWSPLYKPKTYEGYDGLSFFKVKRLHFKRNKKGEVIEDWSGPPRVVNSDGDEFDQNIGNGSVCTVKINVNTLGTKTFVRLEAVRVEELVEYEDTGTPEDDVPF